MVLAMESLVVVEEQLGSVESWPTSVIMDMFHEEPKISVSRRVAAFMYVNGVSLSDAARLYKACQAAWRTFQRPVCTDGICSGICS